jgi:hypothetical protein
MHRANYSMALSQAQMIKAPLHDPFSERSKEAI